ncbi:MAG: twin-arginine translocation pathway signal, partial [Pseudomonadota bacterium]
MDRRSFLRSAIGCSLAASPLVTPVSFAQSDTGALGDNRLVVIILRGAMDGLDVVQPYGDPALPGLRQRLGFGPGSGALD